MSDDKATMQAALLHKPFVITIQEVPRPQPAAGEVLVRVRAVGICGSDMHFYTTGHVGMVTLQGPHIPGHEMSGEVAALGAGVEGLSVGQRVVVEPGLACGHCHYCRAGRYNLCTSLRFLGVPPHHGGMAEYIAVPAQWAFPLPESLSFVEGALIEPLVVGLQGAALGAVGVGHRVAVIGAGPIGLLSLEAALVRGAAQVYVVDVVESRLRLAEQLGATAVINATTADPVAEIRRLTDGRGADVAIECTGVPKAITQTFRAVARGATVVLVGLAEDPTVGLEYTNIVRANIRIETLFRYVNLFPLALELTASGKTPLRPLATHTFPFAETARAFATANDRSSGAVKVVITLP